MNDQSKIQTIGRRASRLHDGTPAVPPKNLSTTKALVLDTAELLFARYGLEGISLREIAAAAGQSNSNVVRYHFENKTGLINAILDDRLKKMDVLREEQLNLLKKSEYKNPRKVLRCLWLPWVLLESSDGSHSFCQFYLYYAMHSGIARHPIFENLATSKDLCKNSKKAEKEFPSAIALIRMLSENFKSMPSELFAKRIVLAGMMLFSSISQHDYERLHSNKKNAEYDIEPILDMALAALQAPF